MVYDNLFLEELISQRHRTVYARITKLTFDELPIEYIEGQITQGSINIDGNSAVRRTCNLTFIASSNNINDYLWTLYSKFRLEVGIKNEINANYPTIIWFNQGVYLVTSFNASKNTDTCTISLSGKDKMCLLNGEVSGSLTSSIDFGKVDEVVISEQDGGTVTRTIKMPLKEIIKEAVHHYAGEPFHNIIITDLDEMGLELQEYRYDSPLYIWRKNNTNEYIGGTLNGNTGIYINNSSTLFTLNSLSDDQLDTLSGDFLGETNSTLVKFPGDEAEYKVARIDYGETAGYTEIDLTYPDELIANVGESITSILDKIKNMLGNFEYFYNTEGQFIFQKKKAFTDSSWTPLMSDESGQQYVDTTQQEYAYKFTDMRFFTSFNNTPNILNLKNDFSVWGTRKSASGGNDIPIHVRYAIDRKPLSYTKITVYDDELIDYNKKYNLQVKGQGAMTFLTDFGTDIKAPYHISEGILRLHLNQDRYDITNLQLSLRDTGAKVMQVSDESEIVTVLDLRQLPKEILYVCDWREVIYQMALDYKKYGHLDDFSVRVAKANPQFPYGRTGYEQYYTDMDGFWRQLYAPPEEYVEGIEYGKDNWNINVFQAPDLLPFWIDFLDSGELFQFSVPVIGDRIVAKNDSKIKNVYNKQTPNIIFTNDTNSIESERTGYRYFTVPGFDEMFIKSRQGISAKEEVDTLLYNHSYCADSISVTSIPIYYLQPNSMIYINDQESGIEGEYIITRLTIPLTYNGTMSINATKATQHLL